MKSKMDFCYKISKEAGISEDEDGNSSECYIKLGLTLKNPISEEKIEMGRERAKGDALQSAADFLKIDSALLTMVTEVEYFSETEEGCRDCQREDTPCDNCMRNPENSDKEDPDLEDYYFHD
jgi:hypothetical protein